MRHFPPIIHIEIERWRYYMSKDCYVSNLGRVKDREGRIKSLGAKNGYLYYRGKAVHRMVMEVWNPVPGYESLTVDHLNHNTRDNRVINLEWVTPEENVARANKDFEENLGDSAKNTRVRLNGVEMPLVLAKQIMLGDSNFRGRQDLIDKFFNKVLRTDEQKTYCSYTAQRVAKKGE